MSNSEILDEFYKFVFAKSKNKTGMGINNDSNGALDKIALAKGIDSRYNTKMLNSFKA